MFETREERQNFYLSKHWRNLREYKLSLNPLCEVCMVEGYMEPATCVDHRVDLVDDPDKALDLNNLTSMCKSCHSRKTLRTQSKKTIKENKKKEKLIVKRLWKM